MDLLKKAGVLEAKIKFSASLLHWHASCDGYAFMVGDDPRLSGVDECSKSGTSFPEGGTSLEDMVMYHAADTLRERNVYKIFTVTDRGSELSSRIEAEKNH